MDLRKLITDYLKQAKMMQVATSEDNQPWVCTVYFVHDKDFNLYWISKPERRHSQEIRNNEKVAGVIVHHHTPGDPIRGIQFQGIAKELTAREAVKSAMGLYAKRYGFTQDRVDAIVNNTDGHFVYKISPSQFVLYDEVNFPESPRQELNL